MDAYVFDSLANKVFGRSSTSVVTNLLLLILLIYLAFRLVIYMCSRIISTRTPKVFIEIMPLASETIEPKHLANFIDVVNNSSSGYLSKMRASFEIHATKSSGIKHIICCPKPNAGIIINQLKSLSPNLTFKITKDYCSDIKSKNKTKIVPLNLVNSNHLPLSLSESDEPDSSDYLRSALSGLKEKEIISFQLLTSKNIRLPKVPAKYKRRRIKLPITIKIVKFSLSLATLPLKHLLKDLHFKNIDLDIHGRDIKLDVQDKIGSKLIKTNARLLVNSSSSSRNNQLVESVMSALSLYSSSDQSIRPKRFIGNGESAFISRRPSSIASSYLSSKEIAGIFNMGSFSTLHKGDQSKRLSRILPLPIALRHDNFEINVGVNNYMGEESPLGLGNEERVRHVYISGGTGSGKTTLLKYMVKQDIKSDRGVAVIDPHGDMAEDLIASIPKSRIKDVIYFNPRDITNPVGINFLEVDSRLSGDDKLLSQDLITEQLVSIFRKIFSKDDSGGNRLEHILRNAVATAFYIDKATIFTVYRLLIDQNYRKTIVSTLEDQSLVSFWQNEFGLAGGMQRVKLSIGITSKIGRFLRSTVTRRILAQPNSTIDFDDIINNKKILICNLSKGLIGEDNSQLLGSIIMAKLQLAAYRRADIKPENRQDFCLYVDEFQNFATNSFLQLLSEGRKYKLLLVMAEQSPSQQDPRYIHNILANVGTVITFRTSSPADEKVLLPLFEPYIAKGEIMNLPAYNFYMKISSVEVVEPTSGMTVKTNAYESTNYDRVVKSSRELYSYKKAKATDI